MNNCPNHTHFFSLLNCSAELQAQNPTWITFQNHSISTLNFQNHYISKMIQNMLNMWKIQILTTCKSSLFRVLHATTSISWPYNQSTMTRGSVCSCALRGDLLRQAAMKYLHLEHHLLYAASHKLEDTSIIDLQPVVDRKVIQYAPRFSPSGRRSSSWSMTSHDRWGW